MLDSQSYIARAIDSGPRGFSDILVDGANDYAGLISAAVSGTPFCDLPLFIAVMEIYSKLLRSHLPRASYVDLLVSLITAKSDVQAFVAKVPRPREEDKA